MVAVALVACIPTGAVVCADGSLCAEGTTCKHLEDPSEDVCATPEQLAACAGLNEHARCGIDGRCYAGVCMPVACGNGRADLPDPDDASDRGEACDDGNQTSGDRCSALCDSLEVCGNGVVDLVAGELCDDRNLVQHDGCDSTCQPESPRWIQLPEGGPGARSDAAMAYDSDRRRVVLFGGLDSTGTQLNDTWEWNGSGWIRLEPPSSPSPRSGHVMAYDPEHRRVVMFGGQSVEILGDTWTWDGTSWTSMAPATSPAMRFGAVMWFDGEHVVMADGIGGIIERPLKDSWAWNGADWVRSAVDAPVSAVAAAFDPKRGKTVLIDYLGATWELAGASWLQVSNTGLPPRNATAMAYDPRSRAVMLFGGSGTTELGDQWRWDGATWLPVAGTPPPPRSNHAMVTDPLRERVVVFGGTPDDPATWEWDGTAWVDSPPLAMPAAANLVVTYNPRTQSAHLLGSVTTSVASFQFDGTSWQPAARKEEVTALNRAAMTFDDVRGLEVLVADDDTYTTDGNTALRRVAAAPPARANAGFAFDGERAILFGGMISPAIVDETWAWDGFVWTQLHPRHAPPARYDMAIGSDPIRHEIVVFGGNNVDGVLGDTWVWDRSDWTRRMTTSSPPAAGGARMSWDPRRQRLVMFGGSGLGALDAVWEWDGAAWSRLPVANAPPSRHGEAWFPTRDGLVSFGGDAAQLGRRLSDTWMLRWDSGHPDEACHLAVDDDGDGLAGCADPDCSSVCTGCGNGVCDPTEDCRICPVDCACTPVCGDSMCDPGEDHLTCPGDC